jgi:hypothetical protein
LELSGKAFNLKRKAFNRKERKDVAKNAKENLERVRFLFLQHDQNGLAFPES